jgi:hypothetical protein
MKCIVCGEKAITTVVFIPVCKVHRNEYSAEVRKQLPIRERTVLWKLVDLDYQKSLRNLCEHLETDNGNI